MRPITALFRTKKAFSVRQLSGSDAGRVRVHDRDVHPGRHHHARSYHPAPRSPRHAAPVSDLALIDTFESCIDMTDMKRKH
jgi:hypothetical protein